MRSTVAMWGLVWLCMFGLYKALWFLRFIIINPPVMYTQLKYLYIIIYKNSDIEVELDWSYNNRHCKVEQK